MRITRKGRAIHLDQCTYLQKVVERCGMLNAKSASTPLPAGYYAAKNTEPVDADLRSRFQTVIGSLLYLMLGTRPDITFAVTHLSRHAANPSQDHLNKALYICHYLIGTSTYSLVYNGGSGAGLIACTDSDWGSDPTSRLLQTGFYLKLADGLISWTSRAQKTIAYSSTEAEYMALSDCAGLTNAPAAFQQFVNTVFADMLDVCVVMYLNDILIYSEDMESHQQHVREVLCHLQLHGLFAKPEKCEFHSDSVEYLGYRLSLEGLTMSPDKIQTISDWPEPRKVKDIQSFLGFANFYCRCIFNYSDIVVPLTWLTWKDAPWNFSKDCRRSFNALKHAFTTAPILTHFILDTPIIVETDASDYAVAGILSIACANGEIRLVAYYSQTLTALELNYDTHNKELLAIFEAFQNWRYYLEGSASPIDVVTDHKNLEYFSTSKVLSRQQARWSEFLSQFNLVICSHPGKLGAKPDTLTR